MYMYLCTHVQVPVHRCHVPMHTCTYAYMYLCIHVPMHTCTLYLCIHVPMHTCVYISELGGCGHFSLLCSGGSPQDRLIRAALAPQGLPSSVSQCAGPGDHYNGVSGLGCGMCVCGVGCDGGVYMWFGRDRSRSSKIVHTHVCRCK